MKPFPKTLYISRENEGNKEEYFQLSVKEKDIPFDEEQKFVGIYELKKVIKVRWELKLHKA